MVNVNLPDEIIDIIDINKHNDNIIDNNKQINLPDEIIDIIDINKHNDNIIDNNKHKDTLSYQSYSTICDDLYNIMKKYQHLLWVCY